MNKEEEDYYVESFEKLLQTYSLEELLSYSDYTEAELLAVLLDLKYIEFPVVNPLDITYRD